ncbi:MAG: hypothetical protein GEU91_08030 [Rhizobiales bacterium]|nr:hypothetical protein [Hyphomicrobiales bacterium]
MMIRILVGGLAFALCVASALAEASAAGARSLPMQFDLRQEGPADICGEKCRSWISAIGTITSETPDDFADFSREHDLRGATLVLDSGGGSVHGAMALGRHIRRFDMTTTVGRTIALPAGPASSERRAKLSPHADCESMCVFVLLSGTTRIVPAGARLLVHQIWLGDRRDDAVAATYSAEDLVLVQRDIGRLAQYTAEMGASVDFLELSLRIPPWEPMRALNRDEIRRMQVEAGPQLIPPSVAAGVTAAAAGGTAASSPTVIGGTRRGHDASARGWIVDRRSGQRVIVRSHPLTIEGVELGSFEITLACGETAGSVQVDYSERRLAANASAIPVRTVTLSVGAQSEPLQVTRSEPLPRSFEVSSRARGSVPASFIGYFSEAGNRALLVSTVSANDARTTIRVGNSGIGPAFARLQESCGSRPLHATNVRTGQAGVR